jgi:hypothetical protein
MTRLACTAEMAQAEARSNWVKGEGNRSSLARPTARKSHRDFTQQVGRACEGITAPQIDDPPPQTGDVGSDGPPLMTDQKPGDRRVAQVERQQDNNPSRRTSLAKAEGWATDGEVIRAAHLCIDMQTIFAEGGIWQTPWIEKAQPTIDAIVSCYRERTACLSNGRSAILHSAATAAGQPQEPCNGLRRPRMSLRGIERRPYALRGLRCYAKGGGANRLTTSQSGPVFSPRGGFRERRHLTFARKCRRSNCLATSSCGDIAGAS